MTTEELLIAFFASDDPAVVRSAAAAVATASSGRIRSPETINARTKRPERHGIYCPVVFGPVEDHSCICGYTRGPERAGDVCSKCGVLCGESRIRDERWGHIELPSPVVHPRLAGAIATVLGCEPAAIAKLVIGRAVLRDDGNIAFAKLRQGSYAFDEEADGLRAEGGPGYLVERLGADADLLVTNVPVTPAGWRQLGSAENDAYLRVLSRGNRLRRLLELAAPQIILEHDREKLQKTFDRTCTVLRAELEERAAARTRAPVPPRAGELLADILADPTADGPRMVYADYLQQCGDPRGELIALQLANNSARVTPREAELLRRHARDWMQPLAPVLEDQVLFRRGFLAKCKTRKEASAELAGLLGHDAWATVEHLDTEAIELIVHPSLRALRRLSITFSTLAKLCERGAPMPQIRGLGVRLSGSPPRAAAAVARSDTFPNLGELMFVCKAATGGADWSWLFATKFLAPVSHLTLVAHLDRIEQVVAPASELLHRQSTLQSLTLSIGIKHYVFELRPDGAETRTAVTVSRAGLERILMAQEEYLQGLYNALARAAATSAHFCVKLPEGSLAHDYLAPFRERLQAMHTATELVEHA